MKNRSYQKTSLKVQGTPVNEIALAALRRKNGPDLDKHVVAGLKDSIARLGLINPITVRRHPSWGPKTYDILAGHHRVQAMAENGSTTISAIITSTREKRSSSLTSSENLHRKHLSVLARSLLLADYIAAEATVLGVRNAKRLSTRERNKIAKRIMPASKSSGSLRKAISRGIAISRLSPKARHAAVELQLENNQRALLAAAKEPADQQYQKLRELAEAQKITKRTKTESQKRQHSDESVSTSPDVEDKKFGSSIRQRIKRRWVDDAQLPALWRTLTTADKAWFVTKVLGITTERNDWGS